MTFSSHPRNLVTVSAVATVLALAGSLAAPANAHTPQAGQYPETLAHPVAKRDRAAGEGPTSASWLRRVGYGHDIWGGAWSDYYRERKVHPRWKHSIAPVMTPKGERDQFSLYGAGDGLTFGRVYAYDPGTRFTISWHRCDGTVRHAFTKVGKGKAFRLALGKYGRGIVPTARAGTYAQVTITQPGKLPEAEVAFVDCGKDTWAWDGRNATLLVDRWGEKELTGGRVGQAMSISTTKRAKGTKITRIWTADGRVVARGTRTFTPGADLVGKRVRVKITVRKGKKSFSHTHRFGVVRAAAPGGAGA